MSAVPDALTVALVLGGLGFFLAGSVGLLRFPDVHSRLHALTKADNLGLGLVALGLALQAPGPLAALKLALVWALALGAAATSAQLIARTALPPDVAARSPDPAPPPAGPGAGAGSGAGARPGRAAGRAG